MQNQDGLKVLIGNLQIKLQAQQKISRLQDSEFQVFSQFGDDGIIQHLIRETKILPQEERFVEFGTQDYSESNTRFLLVNNNWSGMIMDPSEQFMSGVKNSDLYWRHELTAICDFVTPENFDRLLTENKFESNLGLLSIDIDGMDYWVWKSLTVANPVFVVVEYNSSFGPSAKVAVPLKDKFDRTEAHFSNLYWGTSLGALVHLASTKGYAFVGCNSAGNNSYFVRQDRMGSLKALTSEEGFVQAKFRESRDRTGALTYLDLPARMKLLQTMDVFDLTSERVVRFEDIKS